jgi:sugar phosphate isomerase/epimerase
MKFSFSTKGWQHLGWQRLTELARDVRLSGIELHDVFDPALADVALDAQNVGAARRRLQEYGLQVACVDLPADPLNESVSEAIFWTALTVASMPPSTCAPRTSASTRWQAWVRTAVSPNG